MGVTINCNKVSKSKNIMLVCVEWKISSMGAPENTLWKIARISRTSLISSNRFSMAVRYAVPQFLLQFIKSYELYNVLWKSIVKLIHRRLRLLSNIAELSCKTTNLFHPLFNIAETLADIL